MSPRLSFIVIGISAAVCIAIAFQPGPAGAQPMAMPALALTLFAVAMWATGAVPEFVAALVFFLGAAVFAIAPTNVVFAGFTSSAWWLVFSGLIIGAAAEVSGLGQWVARHAFRHAGIGYAGLISAILIGCVLLAFIVPSSVGRMAIALPAVSAVAQEAGHAPGSKGHDGAMLAVVFGSFLLAFGIMPANLINILITGSAETLLGVHVSYGEYLLLQFPVGSVLKGVVMAGLLVWLFGPKDGTRPVRTEGPRPLSREGRFLLIVVLATLVAWSLDFLHGVQAGWVALAAALVCLLPGIGMVSTKLMAEKVSLGTLLFAGAVLSIGPVLSDSGASALLSQLVTDSLPVSQMTPSIAVLVMAYSAAATALATNVAGAVAVVTPLAGEVAAATGLPLKAAALAQVNGLSAPIFPYEALPLMVGLAMTGVQAARAFWFGIALAAVSLLILTPLNLVWWRFLGYVPG